MSAEIRRTNLKSILKDRFSGKPAALGRAVDRDDAYIWQLLHGDRNIGERSARHLESKLGLPKGVLDNPEMAESGPLSKDERDLITKYRSASASWKLILQSLVALRGDLQEEVSQNVIEVMQKASAEPTADGRVALYYGTPGALQQPQAHYKKK